MLRAVGGPAWAGARRLHPGAVLARTCPAAPPSPRSGWPARSSSGRRWSWSASPRGTAARRRRRFVPPMPVRSLPLPRRALYEAWRRFGWPPVERATGPVDVVHATTILVPPPAGVAAGRDAARPGLPATTPGPSPRHGVKAFTAGAGPHPPRTADLVLCSSQATLDDAVARRARPPTPPARPVGPRPGRATVGRGRRGRAAPARPRPIARTCCSSARSSPARTCARLLEAYPLARPRRTQLVVVGPGRLGRRRPPAGERAAAGLRRRGDEGRALRGRRRGLLPQPARGVRPARPGGDGPRRAGRDQPGHGHGRGRRRRGGAGRPARSRRHRPRHPRGPRPRAPSWRRPGRCGRPGSRGPPPPRPWSRPTARWRSDGGRRQPAVVRARARWAARRSTSPGRWPLCHEVAPDLRPMLFVLPGLATAHPELADRVRGGRRAA